LNLDNREDDNFKIRFHLHLCASAAADVVPVVLGEVKILKKVSGRTTIHWLNLALSTFVTSDTVPSDNRWIAMSELVG
jgi:hypothetical protein